MKFFRNPDMLFYTFIFLCRLLLLLLFFKLRNFGFFWVFDPPWHFLTTIRWLWVKTSTKGISSSKCDICTLKLILTLFVQQNYWHFWMRVGSISFVLQNSWHFQMMEEYDRIYLFVFCLSFGNSLGIFVL